MNDQLKIFFDKPKLFLPENIKPLNGIAGLYFIFSKSVSISYPFNKSKLLYIGMSEKRTNSIRNRLNGHFDGKSKNIGLKNYRKVEELFFTYINFEMLKNLWDYRIEDLESYFILDFVEHYGVYPICNNKTGLDIMNNNIKTHFTIDWDYFKQNKIMAEKVKSGKEILDDFFAQIESIENVDPKIAKMIGHLYQEDKLTDANVKNELQQLKTEDEYKDQ